MSETTHEFIELRIEKLVTGGRGLGRHEGQAVFVPLTAPGDLVRAKAAPSKKNFREAELETVLEPGPGRREAPCPHFGTCGGCDLQHLDEAAQQQARREILLDCFQRLGGLTAGEILACAEGAASLGYRNRLRLSAHPTGQYGLKRRGTHDVVTLEQCPVMGEPFAETVLPWLRMLPPVDQIVVRLDGRGGWLLSLYGQPQRQKVLKKMLAGTPEDGAPAPGLQGLLLNNRPLWGHSYLVYHVAGHKYRVSNQSFFQGNLAAAEDAVSTVRSWLDADHPGGGDLADLYGGVGLFTLALADRFDRILLVDSDPAAVLDARENIRREAEVRRKAIVRQDEVDTALADPELRDSLAWDNACVVVDPPRTGLGKPVLAALSELRPRQLIYMSCDPATLARDCAALAAAGYRLERVRLLEMFPQTSHLETVVQLARD